LETLLTLLCKQLPKPEQADGDIVTVTGVLTVSDQFAVPSRNRAIAVLTKQFMVPDYSK
jgi:hypothetical protein